MVWYGESARTAMRKGLFRYEYDARTLRSHYGLERPGVAAR